MTKVVPVKLDDALYERLQQAAMKVGESDSVIIRLALRAGLTQLEADRYEVIKLTAFAAAGDLPGAGAGGLYSRSTNRATRRAPRNISLNEEPSDNKHKPPKK